MQAREALESALQEYDGSCLIVSHDRYFLDQVVDRIVHLRDGHSRVYAGNYTAFAEKMAAAEPGPRPKNSTDKQEFLEFREKSKQRSRQRKALETIRARIEAAEAELAKTESDLSASEKADDWEHLHKTTERVRTLENNILDLYTELDRLEEADSD